LKLRQIRRVYFPFLNKHAWLYGHRPVKTFAQYYHVASRATTARMINSLVERGYISKKRFEGDLKRYKLQLTDSGKHIIESLLPLVKELRLIGYQGINEEDFQTILKVLDQIWKNYEKVSQNNLHSKKKKRTS